VTEPRNVFADDWEDLFPPVEGSESQRGGPLYTMQRLENEIDYLEGEQPSDP
jgi:hypothetical protein